MEILKLLNPSEIIVQIISFLILVFILRIFLWNKVLKLLDQRKEGIVLQIKQIEDSRLSAEQLKAEYQRHLEAIDIEAKEKIKQALLEARNITDGLKKNAYQDAQKIIDNAKQEVKYEVSRAKEELKDQIIGLAIEAAETVIQDKLTEEEDRRIVEDFLDKAGLIKQK